MEGLDWDRRLVSKGPISEREQFFHGLGQTGS